MSAEQLLRRAVDQMKFENHAPDILIRDIETYLSAHPDTGKEDGERWEDRTRWLMDHATYRGGGDGGRFTIVFDTPLDSECGIAQLDAAIDAARSTAKGAE
jgi:hypothetical protein